MQSRSEVNPSGEGSDPEDSSMPMIVSVDDHVVEPADLWQRWLPERFRDRGPRVERRGIESMEFVGGTRYDIRYSDDAPPADCWIYEDLVAPHKRHVAAVGFSRDEMSLSPITYDEMRPGCYKVADRVSDMLDNHVDVSLSFPTFPRFCGQTFLEASDRELAEACVYAYNNWMVEEWCGESGGHLAPLIIIPLWDPELAAEGGASKRPAGGARGVLFGDTPASGTAEHPHRPLGSVLRRV